MKPAARIMTLLLLLLSGAALLAVAAGARFPARDPGPEPIRFLVGMSQATLVEPWRITMNQEIEATASEHEDLRVIFTDAAGDSNRQIEDVDRLMGYGVDLLVISPNESEALRPAISAAYEKIPVIVLDRDVRGEDYTLFIGPNNHMIGRLAGEAVGRILAGRGGNVIEIQGSNDSPPVSARSEGFAEAIAQYPDIKVIRRLVADWRQDQAEDRFKEYLVIYDQPIDVVFAQNDAMAYGAYLAAEKLRVTGIRYVGVDGLQGARGGVEMVKNGILDATFYCPTGGRQAIEYALAILSGEEIGEKRIILDPTEISA
ncbi:MAG: substrate-binding domain-containing protein [Clostridia bacterium]|nr:substrate-binding domain-containing protein [Clostridia bacterium]